MASHLIHYVMGVTALLPLLSSILTSLSPPALPSAFTFCSPPVREQILSTLRMTLQSVLQQIERLSVGILFCMFFIFYILSCCTWYSTCLGATSGQTRKVKGLTFEHSASRVDVHIHVTSYTHTHTRTCRQQAFLHVVCDYVCMYVCDLKTNGSSYLCCSIFET